MASGARIRAECALLRGPAAAVRLRWELLPESSDKGVGGAREKRPASLPLPPQSEHAVDGRCVAEFPAPEQPGPYRLFVHVDGPGSTVAHANFPFLVAGS